MTDNLSLPQVAAAQNQKEVTINAATQQLSGALADYLSVSLASADHALTATEFTGSLGFATTGNAVARTLTIPGTKRALFYVQNGGTFSLSVTCGTTTIAVGAGNVSFFQTDGTANGLIAVVPVASGGEVDVGFVFSGKPTATQIINYPINQSLTLKTSLTGSHFTIGTNPTTNPITFTLNKNGVSIGSIAISSAGAFTVTFAADVAFVAGDIFNLTAPVTQDATAANLGFNFKFVKP